MDDLQLAIFWWKPLFVIIIFMNYNSFECYEEHSELLEMKWNEIIDNYSVVFLLSDLRSFHQVACWKIYCTIIIIITIIILCIKLPLSLLLP